jgi:hypothetical protein
VKLAQMLGRFTTDGEFIAWAHEQLGPVFLATCNAETRQVFRAALGQRLFWQGAMKPSTATQHESRRYNALADAVVDLFVCVGARAFMGSAHSSFSDLAMHIQAVSGAHPSWPEPRVGKAETPKKPAVLDRPPPSRPSILARNITSSVTWSAGSAGSFVATEDGGLTLSISATTPRKKTAAPTAPMTAPAGRAQPTAVKAAPLGWRNIPGWFDFDDIYQQAVDEAQDGATFVEVGTALGRSLAFLVQAIQRSGKKIRVYAVDHWPETLPEGWGWENYPLVKSLCAEGEGPAVAFRKLMAQHCPGWEEHVALLVGTSEEGARRFADLDVKADLVFIDADHSYAMVKRDIEVWRPHVKPGAVLAGHDHAANFPGVVQAVSEAFPDRAVRRTSWWVRL